MSFALFPPMEWNNLPGPCHKNPKIQTRYTNNFWGLIKKSIESQQVFRCAKLERLVQEKWREQERLDDDIVSIQTNKEFGGTWSNEMEEKSPKCW